jgi:hypothetical protein
MKTFSPFNPDGTPRSIRDLSYGVDGKFRRPLRVLVSAFFCFAIVFLIVAFARLAARGLYVQCGLLVLVGTPWLWMIGFWAFKGRNPRWLDKLYDSTWGRLGF